MGVIIRGAKNAFRNWIRTASVVALLAIGITLALSLFLANQAMKTKITQLKQSAATTLTVNAAGSFGSQGGGEPLTAADLAKVKALAHVSDAGALLAGGGGMFRISGGGPGSSSKVQVDAPASEVGLESSIDPGTLGRRSFRNSTGTSGAATIPDIKLPVRLEGLSGVLDRTGTPFKLTSGTSSFSTTDVAEALVGQGLATKNNLKVGSTFTAYKTTFKVTGIFDAGNQFSNDGLYVPLATAQRLTSQPGEVSQILVRVDSIDNLEAVKSAVGSALGSSRVDITSAAQSTTDAVAALEGIKRIALTGVIVALGAAAVITFLVMVMIVRERRREIGVLKAIGASNLNIVGQFVTEAFVLTLCGAVLGIALAAVTSNQITGGLLSANAPAPTRQDGGGPRSVESGPGGGFAARVGEVQESAESLVSSIQTNVGLPLLGQGLAVALLIALMGSAIPAWLIAKVRPAEVMRGE